MPGSRPAAGYVAQIVDSCPHSCSPSAGLIFKLSTETLILTFSSDDVSSGFTQVSRYIQSTIRDVPDNSALFISGSFSSDADPVELL